MKHITDLTGKRFGRLEVIARYHEAPGRLLWLAGCDCGEATMVTTGNLNAGHAMSCGCLRRERNRKRGLTFNRSHGRSRTAEYRIWRAMIARCTNPNNGKFSYYGGRGITVCERWLTSFQNFLADMGERPTPTHSIDRVNNESGYGPNNCRWATTAEQAANRRFPQFTDEGRAKLSALMRERWRNGKIVPKQRKA